MGRLKLVSQIKKGQETAPASSWTTGSTVPSASEIGDVFVGKTNSSQGSIAKTVNVLLSVLPYNDEATLYGNYFPEGPMSVIHCLHEQKPSVFWQFMTMLDAYITVRKEEDPEFPEDRNMLEVAMQCKFVFTKAQPVDEDRHCLFKAWRVAIYCGSDAASVKQIIMFIDGFVSWYALTSDVGKGNAHDL